MKSTHKAQRFDYTKIVTREDYRYFGIHAVSGRLHIDTKRYIKIMTNDQADCFIPNGLKVNRNTVYFIPRFKHRYDYKYNQFYDSIDELKEDWIKEYKPIFAKIQTPKDLYDSARLNGIMYTSSAEDIPEIEVEAGLLAFKREKSYYKIIRSLYCMFILKLATEVDRIVLNVISQMGYNKHDFSLCSFIKFTKENYECEVNKIANFEVLDKLHKISNFIKHNTQRSYYALKNKYPDCIIKSEKKYENGMFACEWIVLENSYIDDFFDQLIVFFKNYCKLCLKEDVEEAGWNYDDYFRKAFKEVKNIKNFLGV